eukprot:1780686-Rhodomonas_salina.1
MHIAGTNYQVSKPPGFKFEDGGGTILSNVYDLMRRGRRRATVVASVRGQYKILAVVMLVVWVRRSRSLFLIRERIEGCGWNSDECDTSTAVVPLKR